MDLILSDFTVNTYVSHYTYIYISMDYDIKRIKCPNNITSHMIASYTAIVICAQLKTPTNLDNTLAKYNGTY